jgi:uncharacterized DUF497 family protein
MPKKRNFDWLPKKAAINIANHKLAFDVAIQVFDDPKVAIVPTIREQDGEDRYKAIGEIEGRLFVVVFTMRGEITWVISARRTNRSEDKRYAERRP